MPVSISLSQSSYEIIEYIGLRRRICTVTNMLRTPIVEPVQETIQITSSKRCKIYIRAPKQRFSRKIILEDNRPN